MRNKIKKIDKDWWWPKDDGEGDIAKSCWHYMQSNPNTPELVSKYVEDKKVVVQAGGNCGFYVKQYAHLFETVYTFEPDPVNFFCLNLNVTETNVIKIQGCLGSSHGGVGLENYLPDVGATHVSGAGIYPTFTIDDLNLSGCDLIHLDIEGYELFAFQGARNTLEKFKPVVCFEFHDAWAGRYSHGLNEIERELVRYGYAQVGTANNDKIFKVG